MVGGETVVSRCQTIPGSTGYIKGFRPHLRVCVRGGTKDFIKMKWLLRFVFTSSTENKDTLCNILRMPKMALLEFFLGLSITYLCLTFSN